MRKEPPHYLEAELGDLFRVNDEMWRFVQEASLDGVWYWDLQDTDNLWISPEYWESLGIDPATRRHSPEEFVDVVFEEDLPKILDNLERHYADPSVKYEQIVRFRHKNGSTVWIRCKGVATRDADGNAIRMLGAHNNITAVKQAEDQAKVALKEAAAANEELRSFAYSISHDLKSPSNTMDMILKEIVTSDQNNMSDDQRELVEMAQCTANQMRNLVEEMLAYTRLVGEDPIRKPVDLGQLAYCIQDLLAGPISETEAEILVCEDLPVVLGHPAQLRTLMQNLVENAIKYREPSRRPTVKITGLRNEEVASTGFCVSDNGIGIEKRHLKRVFEMFRRLHRADEVAGAGLGLTLCRRVALNHGGDIRVESCPGQGTTFTVKLPGKVA